MPLSLVNGRATSPCERHARGGGGGGWCVNTNNYNKSCNIPVKSESGCQVSMLETCHFVSERFSLMRLEHLNDTGLGFLVAPLHQATLGT